MTADEYQALAARTECDQKRSLERLCFNREVTQLLPIRLNHAVIGMMGEVGELVSQLEKWIYYGRPLDVVNVSEEL